MYFFYVNSVETSHAVKAAGYVSKVLQYLNRLWYVCICQHGALFYWILWLLISFRNMYEDPRNMIMWSISVNLRCVQTQQINNFRLFISCLIRPRLTYFVVIRCGRRTQNLYKHFYFDFLVWITVQIDFLRKGSPRNIDRIVYMTLVYHMQLLMTPFHWFNHSFISKPKWSYTHSLSFKFLQLILMKLSFRHLCHMCKF
jgi:hypothetical protein